MMRRATTTKRRVVCGPAAAGVFALFSLLLVAPRASADIGSWFSDGRVNKAVTHYIAARLPADSAGIDVNVKEGVVTLSGKASTYFTAQRADDIAKTVRGVRAVINELEIKPTNRTDDEIRKEIVDGLWIMPSVERGEIGVRVDKGLVTLTGTVDSWQERVQAKRAAARTRGVRAVINEIKLADIPVRSEADILADVNARLYGDALVDAAYVTARVHQRTVYLTGTASSVAQRERAIYDAWVRGVKEVKAEGLKVDPSTRQKLRRKRMPVVTDATAKKSLEMALRYDPRVPAAKIDVEVKSNRATLSGTVASLVAYEAAAEDARNTVGVTSVRNLLSVRWPASLDDAAIKKKLDERLAAEPVLDGRKIKTDVSNGIAYLSGKVPTRMHRWVAEDRARYTAGVIAVIDNLEATYQAKDLADEVLEETVEANLRLNPFVEAKAINVATEHGTVTLTGMVDTLAARMAAEQAAHLAGAKAVKNWITLRPFPSK